MTLRPPLIDPSEARAMLRVGDRSYAYHRLEASGAPDLARLPYTVKVLLENALRNAGGTAGLVPAPVEALFTAVAVRMAAEAAGVPEVRAEGGRVVLKWPRYDRAAVARALTLAGFRPVASSNQVRIPVATGRDPVDIALRALAALSAPMAS